MPRPERLARRSVALLTRQGLPRGQAAEVIIHICDDAAHRLYVANHDADTSWLAAVRAEASTIWRREGRPSYWLSCPSLVPHGPHDWWPHPNRRASCEGISPH